MRKSILIAAAVLVAGPLALSPAGDSKDVAAIVDKAIKAHGGADTLAKQAFQAWKAKGKMQAFGMKLEYDAEYFFQLPDKLRFDMSMSLGGKETKLTVVTDGKSAWESAEGKTREMEKDKFEEFRHLMYVLELSQVTPLKGKKYKLTPLPAAKVGDKEVVGIKVSAKDKRDVKMYFDAKTGLLAKTETRVLDEFSKKEVDQETLIDRYTTKGGVPILEHITIKRDGTVFLEEAFTNQSFSEKGDPKVFSKPGS